MAFRQTSIKRAPPRPELDELIARALRQGVSDAEWQEQRVSFVYGNAPEGSRITKDSARAALKRTRLLNNAS